jgi:acyl-CoA oxidase
MSATDAWNAYCPDVVRASEAHCFYVLVKNFNTAVDQLQLAHSPLAAVMCRVKDLFALWWMQQRLGEFYESGYLADGGQAEMVREGVRRALRELRPDAVPLCDAWGHTDHSLNSVLGRRDGQVYDALFASAQAAVNPMNEAEVDKAFEESIKHFHKAASKSTAKL